MNKKIVHDALILTAFTLVLGLVLGLVHDITKEPIEAAEQAKTEAAYRAVFESADSFRPYDGYDKEEAAALLSEAGYLDEITDVEEALDASGNVLGYVITVIAKDGSQANITFSVGITAEGVVNGYSITDIAETPGLGDKAKNEEFYSQFEEKQVDSFTVVKQQPAAEEEIEAISGATITSKAMANGVNACLTYYKTVLKGGTQA
ncbi:MAG: RnfABCDGE type electron transport complex subunit G [Lachnospiraceae bacterium]|nr:RnfABCDGE type electron transport complex subunit G [Lachnospiraceae bacterium]